MRRANFIIRHAAEAQSGKHLRRNRGGPQRLLLASLSAWAGPLSEKADLMSRHVPLLRWTPMIQSNWNALYIFIFERKS